LGPDGISECIAATEKRLILFKLVGTPDPVASEALWDEVRSVEWIDSPGGVTLVFRGSQHNKQVMERLPGDQAQEMVEYAIDHGNRVTVKVGQPGSAGATTNEPPQGLQGWYYTAADMRRVVNDERKMTEQSTTNPRMANSRQQAADIQPLPQRPITGSLLEKIKPLRNVLNGMMRGSAHGVQESKTPQTPITGQQGVVEGEPQPPADKSVQHNGTMAQTESRPAPTPFTFSPLTTGPRLGSPATYDLFSQPYAPNYVSGGLVAAQAAGTEGVASGVAGTPNQSAIAPPAGTQAEGAPELRGVDFEEVAPFVPPSEDEVVTPFQIKPPASVPGGSVPIRGRLSKNGVSPGQGDPLQKLKQLRQMLEAGLITQEDFERKKAEILARM
jgi:hypothetical protein